MSYHSCRVTHVVSCHHFVFILTYFNCPGGSTRRLRMDIFVQVFASMVSYGFFSDKWPDWVKHFGLACKKRTLFVDFWMKLVEASYASKCRRFCRVFCNTFVFFWFARRLGTCVTTRTFGASFRVKLSHIHYQTCREYRTILSSLTWNHTAVLAKREFHQNS